MKELTVLMAVAGLLHDIGKFAERADAVKVEDVDMVRQEFHYAHAIYTAQSLQKFWGDLVFRPLDGFDTEINLYNLASRHHRPRNPYEVIVSEADRLSAGHERVKADEYGALDQTAGTERKNQIPLHSILERIMLEFNDEEGEKISLGKADVNSRYKLRPLRFGQENNSAPDLNDFFPVHYEAYQKDTIAQDYKILWSSFCRELSDSNVDGLPIDPIEQYESLFYLMQKYTWCIPESTQYQKLPDVSLFEHLKITATLSVCLLRYHMDNERLEENAIRDRAIKKYVLLCGDLSGIQKFIYNISSKGAYKSLKGRSFFVQIASDIIARFYLAELMLPITNLLYASGGKFYLLLPNESDIIVKIKNLDDEVNKKLYEDFKGSVFLRTGFEQLTGDALNSRRNDNNLCQLWESLTRKVVFSERKKYARIATSNYDLFFKPRGTGGERKTCDVCHEELETERIQDGEIKKCNVCYDMENFGRNLGKARFILVQTKDTNVTPLSPSGELLGRKIYLEHQLPVDIPSGTMVYCLNNNNFLSLLNNIRNRRVTVLPIMLGGNHRFEREFDEIAKDSKGIERLGVMRMDVDNLGLIFSDGLKKYKYGDVKDVFFDERQYEHFNFYSMGRITTLSFQLAYFFGSIVQTIVESEKAWKDRAVIVYSGGDDLFMLGSWDILPEIALKIRTEFSKFVCDNPAFTLSGGMVMVGGKFPIYKSAEMAGNAEDLAKNLNIKFQDGKKQEKNAFSFLDFPMNWEEFAEIYEQKKKLIQIINEDAGNRALVTRLQQIAGSYQRSKREIENRQITRQELNDRLLAEKWRWRMIYSLSRFFERKSHLRDTINALQNFILSPIRKSQRKGIDLLHVLARWVEFVTRN